MPAPRRRAPVLLAALLATVLMAGVGAAPDARAQRPDPARVRAAGLTAAQADTLAMAGYPVLAPALPAGWALAALAAEPEPFAYRLAYRHTGGACFTLDGVADAFAEGPDAYPDSARAAPVAAVPFLPEPLVYWADEAVDADAPWDPMTLRSDVLEGDGIAYVLASAAGTAPDDGPPCRRLGVDEAVALMAGLRYLDPADDPALGPFAPLDLADAEQAPRADLAGPDPVALARAIVAPEGSAARVSVEALRRTDTRAVVLVTEEHVTEEGVTADAATRDRRTRAVLLLDPRANDWYLAAAGRQVRCRPGHGAADWSPDPCE